MRSVVTFGVIVTGLGMAAPVSGKPQGGTADSERVLYKEVVVETSLERVWNAWTTEEGMTFISTRSRIELEVGGAYELFLDGPVESDGRRGAEGSRVLAFVPREMLAFDWTFPPAVMELRAAGERTQVVIMFDSLSQEETRVRLYALGWRSGPTWDEAYAYFDRAWGMVLGVLKQSLESEVHAGTNAADRAVGAGGDLARVEITGPNGFRNETVHSRR